MFVYDDRAVNWISLICRFENWRRQSAQFADHFVRIFSFCLVFLVFSLVLRPLPPHLSLFAPPRRPPSNAPFFFPADSLDWSADKRRNRHFVVSVSRFPILPPSFVHHVSCKCCRTLILFQNFLTRSLLVGWRSDWYGSIAHWKLYLFSFGSNSIRVSVGSQNSPEGAPSVAGFSNLANQANNAEWFSSKCR